MRWVGRFAVRALLRAVRRRPRVDLIIRGGTVYTGDGRALRRRRGGSGDRIRAVGRRLSQRAAKVIDARGMIVAPGFIDPHAHIGRSSRPRTGRRG
jgi:cytosine/adenosine deaminase-related metal-dependent hydrolase